MSELQNNSCAYVELIRTVCLLKPEAVRMEEDVYYSIWRYDNTEFTYRLDTEGGDGDVTAAAFAATTVWMGSSITDTTRGIRRQIDFDIESGFATRRETFLTIDTHPTRQESGKVSNKYVSTQVSAGDSNPVTVGKGI